MNEHEQDPGIDGLIRDFLAYTGARACAIPDNNLHFSQSNRSNNHPNHRTRVLPSIPDEEVISLFRFKAQLFLELHRQHVSPVDLTRPLSVRLGGCCGHLKDDLQRVLVEDMPQVSGHVNSNAPYERLCLTCIRQRDLAERYQCTLCGGRNPTPSKLYRHTAVEITPVEYAPLVWHVPMCRRCFGVIESAFQYTGFVPPAEHVQEVSSA